MLVENDVRRPNVLVLLSDEHSAREVGCYGSRMTDTPSIDRLARNGVLFENAYCNAPLCVPSRLSFLSGKLSSRIGAWSNACRPNPDVLSLPRLLGNEGYYTEAIGKMHFVGDTHWGFQSRSYGDLFGTSHQPDPIRTAPKIQLLPAGPAELDEEQMQETIVTDLGIRFLSNYQDTRPFCLFLSYNRPHFPLRPPKRLWDKYYPDSGDLPNFNDSQIAELHPWMEHHRRYFGVQKMTEEEIRACRAGYRACVEFIDEQIGRVLDALDRSEFLDNTIVIYMSDHGEMLGEHGLWRKSSFYEEAMRVPLIFSYPSKLPKGKRVRSPVQLVDLVPTVLSLTKSPQVTSLDGTDLFSEAASPGAKYSEHIIGEYFSHGVLGPMRMIRLGDWKYCMYLGARPSLYNLNDDPYERSDLFDDGPIAKKLCVEFEELLRKDWDEAAARAAFQYIPDPKFPLNRSVKRPPNQRLTSDGTYVDVETFYDKSIWGR